MADSIAGAYANLAGIEIVNNARALEYLKNSTLGSIQVYGDCGCSNIFELIGCPSPSGIDGYTDPVTDDAPWYTPDIPASKDFLGFVYDEFDGLDSPFKRTVTQAIGHGGILSRSRLNTRELTWRGYLFGNTCCGTQYGLRWLTQTLSRFDTGCADCLGDDLEILICCPDDAASATGQSSPFRILKGVGLLEGPKILSQHKTCSNGCSNGCGGSCILEIEFTLIATQPYLYSPEIPVYDCVNLYDGSISIGPPDDTECPPINCVNDICAPTLPPTASYQNSCAAPFSDRIAKYLTVPRDLWNELDEVVPIISIFAPFGLDAVGLGFYSSVSGDPCGDLLIDPPDCDLVCDTIQIINIPPLSTFYIDGRTRRMSVICADGSAFPGEKITTGPWSWPTFNCFGFCMQIVFENDPLNHDFLQEQKACISLSLVPRSF